MKHCFHFYCVSNGIEGDMYDVFTSGGRWFGQVRKVRGVGNTKETVLLSEYRLALTKDENNVYFDVTKIRDFLWVEKK